MLEASKLLLGMLHRVGILHTHPFLPGWLLLLLLLLPLAASGTSERTVELADCGWAGHFSLGLLPCRLGAEVLPQEEAAASQGGWGVSYRCHCSELPAHSDSKKQNNC